MATYLMLGRYSASSVKGISSGRTKKAEGIIKKNGGRVRAMYVLVGNHDLALLVDFPGAKNLLRAAVAIAKLSGIGFASYEAVPVAEFDRMIK